MRKDGNLNMVVAVKNERNRCILGIEKTGLSDGIGERGIQDDNS